MTIYGRPDQLSIGKDIPAMGPFKGFKPNIVGPGAGKIKVLIYGGIQVGRFVLSRPWAKGTITGTLIGTGLTIGDDPTQSISNQFNQTLRPVRRRFTRKRRYKVNNMHNCCCPTSSRRYNRRRRRR